MACRLLTLIALLASNIVYSELWQTSDISQWQVFIDVVRGEDSTDCLSSNSTAKTCRSLSFVVENFPQKEMVTITLLSHQINLTKPVEFKNYTHLIIGGCNTTLYCNESNAGLSFVLVQNLTIVSMTVEHCGALRETTAYNPNLPNQTLILRIAVYVLNCTNVTISNVDVVSSNGTGMSMYDTNGMVNITHCTFNENRVTELEEGGGGLHIEFTICSVGMENCSGHNGRNNGSRYILKNCKFFNNVARSFTYEFVPQVSANVVPRTGKGGGLYISIGSDAIYNHLVITDTQFENNSAYLNSGGLLVEFMNSVQNNTISLLHVHFKNNSCSAHQVCCGGGLLVALLFYSQAHVHGIAPKGNMFLCHKCMFEQNTAYVGGGTGILATKDSNVTSCISSIVEFSNCQWISNASPTGAAVYISPSVMAFTEEGFLPVPQFVDCTFERNSAFHYFHPNPRINISSVGYGAVFSSQVHLKFKGYTEFSDNQGSGLYLPNSKLEFCEGSNVTFVNNVAHNGGAIAMYGSTVMHINNNSSLTFTNNRAYSRGGAMYSDVTAAIQPSYRTCFIQPHLQWGDTKRLNTKLIFHGNNASLDGKDIFITTLRPCRALCPKNVSANDPKSILSCIANFVFSESHSESPLSTRPQYFRLNTSDPMRVIPGSKYYLPLLALDEANSSLSGLVYQASTDSENITIDPAFMQVSHNIIVLHGISGDKGHLHLSTFDTKLSLEVEIAECKPGYIMNGVNGTCQCVVEEYLGLVPLCGETVYIKNGYWMGFCVNSTKLCTTFCPNGICSYHKMNPKASIHRLPTSPKELESQLCGPKRHGRVCSKCTDGNSVYFHSPKYTCDSEKLCHLGLLFYLLSEILPLTLLYIVIVICNASFTCGNLNGCVFFIQILHALNTNANSMIEFPYFMKVFHDILMFIYGPFTLEFFTLEQLSFCLWKGATVIDAMIMKCVTVAYAFLLVLSTIVFARYFKFKFSADSILVHGLSTFFVMCYSQIANFTLNVLTYFCLYSTNFKCEEKVMNYMGYLTYFKGDHIKYAIPAIVILAFFIVIPQLLLLLYPLMFKILGFCKLSESRLPSILWRMIPIPLLDSFQGAFKENLRFFAGLYFLYRALIHFAFAFCRSLISFYSVVELLLVLALAIHSLCQPYKERKHNMIDSLLFLNLAIINGVTIYNATGKDFKGEQVSEVITIIIAFVQLVLMSIPFFYIIVFIIVKCKERIMIKEGLEELPSLRRESEPLIRRP